MKDRDFYDDEEEWPTWKPRTKERNDSERRREQTLMIGNQVKDAKK